MSDTVFDALKHANSKERKRIFKSIEEYSKEFPEHLIRQPLPKSLQGKQLINDVVECWRSRRFAVIIYYISEKIERMSVNRAEIDLQHLRWKDGISWDDLQRLKRECGRGHLNAYEVYPADENIVNVANMRHLWVMKEGSLYDQGIGWKG